MYRASGWYDANKLQGQSSTQEKSIQYYPGDTTYHELDRLIPNGHQLLACALTLIQSFAVNILQREVLETKSCTFRICCTREAEMAVNVGSSVPGANHRPDTSAADLSKLQRLKLQSLASRQLREKAKPALLADRRTGRLLTSNPLLTSKELQDMDTAALQEAPCGILPVKDLVRRFREDPPCAREDRARH